MKKGDWYWDNSLEFDVYKYIGSERESSIGKVFEIYSISSGQDFYAYDTLTSTYRGSIQSIKLLDILYGFKLT